MKNKILSKIRSDVKKQYPNYSEDKVDEIMYGVEGIYILITKTIIILTISIIFGIFKELLLLLLMFNLIRMVAFGMHASNSGICLVLSSIIFLAAAYLCKTVTIPNTLLYILYLIVLLIVVLYAPADTVKRPLIKKKKRNIYKILSISITIIFFIISIIIKNNLIINSMIFGLLIECLLILPITYKIFKLPYRNYLNYGLNTWVLSV